MLAPESSYTTPHPGQERNQTYVQPSEQEPWYDEHIRRLFYNHGINLYYSTLLGKGHFATVITAGDQTGPIAIKVINKATVASNYRNSFLPRELDLWKRLMHPNLIKLTGQYEVKPHYTFLAMEFGQGGDLLRHVQTCGAVPEKKSGKWMVQIMNGLRHMHSLNIAHRDLKLENIIIFNEDTVKIADFGFATEAINRRSTTFCGSRSYVAPEILEGKPYDPFKSDIWSMGVVAFVMVTDRMPFDETRPTNEMLQNQMARNYAYPRGNKLSTTCCYAIDRMMTFRSDVRPGIEACYNFGWPVRRYYSTRG